MDTKAILAHYEKLLNEQIDRARRLEQTEPFDFTSRPLRIAIAPGDGIGPTIMASAESVLRILLRDEIERGEIVLVPVEGLTIENRLARSGPVRFS